MLDTLRYLVHETDVWLEITTLLIPGQNDSDEEIDAMTRWVVGELGSDVPMHFTAFHPDWRMREIPATPTATLARARRIAIANGVRYAYTGNVYDPEGGSTYCSGCGAALIRRVGYDIESYRIDASGFCPECGARCAGVFDPRAGDWGSRRLPVRMRDEAR